MDISTILGIILGFAVIIYGIGMESLGNFIDTSSIFITVGGTFCALMASFPLKQLVKIGVHMKIVLFGNKFKPEEAINKLVDLAQLARKNGLLALEEQAGDIKDPFFKRGVLLVVDAMEAEKVRSLLEEEIAAMDQRHDSDVAFYEKGSIYAPAFGMIGTLVGLINMLKEMNLDEGSSSSLGLSMATALVTTFYGCLLANLIFQPIAKKLRIRNDDEILYRQIIVEGVVGIQCGDNPKSLKEKLVSTLSQKQQNRMLNDANAKKGGRNRDKSAEE